MNALGKRLHPCLFREIKYQINYQNNSNVNKHQTAHVSNRAEDKQDSNKVKKEVNNPKLAKGLIKQKLIFDRLLQFLAGYFYLKKIHIKGEPPADVKCDWVGPPDSTSHIRPVKLHIPADETELEQNYRLKREELIKWNHDFWSENNANFIKEKEEFIKEKTSQNEGSDNKDISQNNLTPEEMSVFYREFLRKYYQKHFDYNVNWYRRNIQLLWPALQVAVYGVKKKMFPKKP